MTFNPDQISIRIDLCELIETWDNKKRKYSAPDNLTIYDFWEELMATDQKSIIAA
ncbi:MAG: hypothetical protein Q8862_10360 [Bacteroidota bacterium]|nr:hypothetical protein [Bacteroidota bacterium]